MTTSDLLFPLAALVLAIATALAFEQIARRRRVFPWLLERDAWRRWAARLVLVGALGILYSSLAGLGPETAQPDLTEMHGIELFLLHFLLLASLAAWYLVAFGGFDRATFARQLGLKRREWPIWQEIALGVGGGVAIWAGVIGIMLAIGAVLFFTLGPEAMPTEPPAMIPFMAALPLALRIALALSAGVVEELFFRGFLQPRMGILLSTAVFAVAHASYGEPLQLVAVTLLSLAYGLLVRWRRSIWAAIVAHFMFDLIQLVLTIPAILGQMPELQGPP